MDKLRANQYQSAYLADYGFESVMVRYRREFVLERLSQYHPAIVVEIGCGSELMYKTWINRGGQSECWVIVEPAEKFVGIACKSGLPNLHVFNDFFEKAVDRVLATLPRQPDLVICSGLLHEVPDAAALLKTIHQVMGDQSLLHLNVPNSESLHRRLARAMGLIKDTKAMSERNIKLMQPRVFDMHSLKKELAGAGFHVFNEGGYLIKPFTHEQMEKIAPAIGGQVLDGLYLAGKEMPELASEIYVEVRKVNFE